MCNKVPRETGKEVGSVGVFFGRGGGTMFSSGKIFLLEQCRIEAEKFFRLDKYMWTT